MKTNAVITTVILLLLLPAAQAVEPLSATTLNYYCEGYTDKPESTLSQKCVAYVGGFLDGAVATDARVAENVVEEIEKEETFSERAIRTRVYGRLGKYGPSVYAGFCVGQPVPIKDVVLHVIEELDSRESLADVEARQIVYSTLKTHYACEP